MSDCITGSYESQHDGYRWIKAKKWWYDSKKTLEENFKALQEHHVAETTFLIQRIRELARELDRLKQAS